MSRLSPGIYVFLQAKLTNILDEDTFGSEAVSATSIFYRVMQSIDDIKNTAKFGLAVLDAKNLVDMKALQVGLTTRLAQGDIDLDTWVVLDGKYEGIIQVLKDRLAQPGQDQNEMVLTNENPHILEAVGAIKRLKQMSSRHQNIATLIEKRIESGHYTRLF
jgi:hypothetical protein